MKFVLVGQHGYRGREQFFREFEAVDLIDAEKLSHELMISCLGGEDREYLEKELNMLHSFRILEIASDFSIDCEDSELQRLLSEVQSKERANRKKRQIEADERELARIKARLGQT